MNNVKQTIQRLRDRFVTDQLQRENVLKTVRIDVWMAARKIYNTLFDSQKQLDECVVCTYKLISPTTDKTVGYIENYYDDCCLVGLTYKAICLKEELSIDALYDSVESVEHMKFMIVSKLYENLAVSNLQEL